MSWERDLNSGNDSYLDYLDNQEKSTLRNAKDEYVSDMDRIAQSQSKPQVQADDYLKTADTGYLRLLESVEERDLKGRSAGNLMAENVFKSLKNGFWGMFNWKDIDLDIVDAKTGGLTNEQVTRLGEGKANWKIFQDDAKRRGLDLGSSYYETAQAARDYIYAGLGEDFSGVLEPEAEKQMLQGAFLTSVISQSTLNDDADLDDVSNIILDKINPGLRVPFQGTPTQYKRDYAELQKIQRQLYQFVKPSVSLISKRQDPAMNNLGYLDKEVAFDWYRRITGSKIPAESVSVENMWGTINSHIRSHERWQTQARQKVKWAKWGIDMPIDSFQADGSMTLHENPLTKDQAVRHSVMNNIGAAYSPHESSYARATNKVMDEFEASPGQFVMDLLQSNDEQKNKRVRQLANSMERKKGQPRLWNNLRKATGKEQAAMGDRGFADLSNDFNAAIQRKKHKYSTDYINSSMQIYKDQLKGKGLSRVEIDRTVASVRQARAKEIAASRRLLEKSEGHEIANLVQGVEKFLGTAFDKTVGQVTPLMSGVVWKPFMEKFYADRWNDLMPKGEHLRAGRKGTAMEAAKDALLSAVPLVGKTREELMQEYSEKALTLQDDDYLSRGLNYVALPVQMFLRDLSEMPFAFGDDPVGMSLFLKGMGLYGRHVSSPLAKRIAKHNSSMGAAAQYILEPWNPEKAFGVASKGGFERYLKIGQRAGTLKRRFNALNPQARELYSKHKDKVIQAMREGGVTPNSVQGLDKFSYTMNNLLAKLESDGRLTNADIKNMTDNGSLEFIPADARQALFNTPFGDLSTLTGRFDSAYNRMAVKDLEKMEADIFSGADTQTAFKIATRLREEIQNAKAEKLNDNKILNRVKELPGIGNMAGLVTNYISKRVSIARDSLFREGAIREGMKRNAEAVQSVRNKRIKFMTHLNVIKEGIREKGAELKALPKAESITSKSTKRIEELGARRDQLRGELNESIGLLNGIQGDMRKLERLEQSKIIDRENTLVDREFKDVENGWRSDLSEAQQDVLLNEIAKEVHANPDSMVDYGLSKTAKGKIDAYDKAYAEQVKKISDRYSKDRGKRDTAIDHGYKKLIEKKAEAIKVDRKRIFSEKPNKDIRESIMEAKQEADSFMDVLYGSLGKVGPRGVFSQPMSSILTSLMVRAEDPTIGQFLRLKTQKINSMAQDLLSQTVKHADSVENLSTQEKATISKFLRMTKDEFNAVPKGELEQLALQIRGVRNKLLDAAVDVGKLTVPEANRLKTQGYDPHFYLKYEHKSQLKKYSPTKMSIIDPTGSDAPKFGRLNVQQKLGTARVMWKDRAKGKWTIEDFSAKDYGDVKGARKAASKFREKLQKDNPSLEKNDIRSVAPLTEAQMAMKGLIKNDVEYQIKALQNMLTDISKTKLLNEIGLMSGLVKAKIDDGIPHNAKGDWTILGQDFHKLSGIDRTNAKYKWGNLAGKAVHRKFFDYINSFDDYTSTISNIAEMLRRDTDMAVKTATSQMEKAMKGTSHWVNKLLRRTLIAENPVCMINNVMGALTFSFMSGADVRSRGFWSARNTFEDLFYKVGSEGFGKKPNEDLFKYAINNGLIERTGAAMSPGGKLSLTAKVHQTRPWQVGKIWKEYRKRRGSDRKKLLSKVDEYKESIDAIDTVLRSEQAKDLSDLQKIKLQKSRDIYKEQHNEWSNKLQRHGIREPYTDYEHAVEAVRGWGQDKWRRLKQDPEAVLSQIWGEYYGGIDPKMKWATFLHLIKDKGMSKEEALQVVLENHQNYGAINPMARKMKDSFGGIASFVPSFPIEAGRILINNLKRSPERTMAILMAPAMFNYASLSSQGIWPSDLKNKEGLDTDWQFMQQMFGKVMTPIGDGEVASTPIWQWTPFAAFTQPPSVGKDMLQKMEKKMGPVSTAAVMPLVNYFGNFILNHPIIDAGSKSLYNYDSFTGRASYDPNDPTATLADMGKNLMGFAVSRGYANAVDSHDKYTNSPTSAITRRNTNLLEAVLRNVGVRLDMKEPSEQRAALALSFAHASLRKNKIQDFMSNSFKHDVVQLGSMRKHSPEWGKEVGRLADIYLDKKKGTLTVGTDTWDVNMSPRDRDAAVKQIIKMSSRNIYSTIEQMAPDRRVRYLSALNTTWGTETKEFVHTLNTLTKKKHLTNVTDLVKIMKTVNVCDDKMTQVANPHMQELFSDIKGKMMGRAVELLRSRYNKKSVLMDLLDSTKGNVEKKRAEIFARELGLIRF